MDGHRGAYEEGYGEATLQALIRENQGHAPRSGVTQQKRAPHQLPIPEAHLACSATARARLEHAYPDAGPDERILHELAAEETVLAAMLQDVERQLAARLLVAIHDPRSGLLLAKALKQVAESNASVSRRIRDALQAAAALRAQRRVLDLPPNDV